MTRMRALCLTLLIACAPGPDPDSQVSPAAEETADLSGPYLGQQPPGSEPQPFAPGIVSTGLAERDFAMTPDGGEIYYTSVIGAGFNFSTIVRIRQIEGRWTDPEIAPFSGRYKDLEPAISPDGQRFFFVSTRPPAAGAAVSDHEDIWGMQRQAEDWSAPRNLGSPVNTDSAEFFPSVARNGNLYFTRRGEDRSEAIYRSRWLDGAYQEPERLAPEVNAAPTQFNAYIDPDERFLIVCSWGREDSLGGVDYYVVFRSEEDRWTGPVNLGEPINTPVGQEWSPYVSPDGRYFFFMSTRSRFDESSLQPPLVYDDLQQLQRAPLNGNSDIWWVEASFIERLRPVDP